MLKPLKRAKPFKPYAVIDIETRKDEFLVAGLTTDGEKVDYFTNIEEIIDFFFQKRFRGWILYAHFGGGFDFRFLLPAMRKRFGDDKIQIFQQGGRGRIFLIKLRRAKNLWTLADSYSIMPASLKSLANAFQTKHRKLESPDFSDLKDNAETREYLSHDVLSLYETIKEYRKLPEIAASGQAYTLPQCAMQTFRSRLRYSISQLSESEEEFVRLCSYGGRTEVFKRKGYDLACYDVNSMYPFVMRNNPMPVGNAVVTDTVKKGKPGFYLANIKLKDSYIPQIPYYHKGLGRLIFPVGNLENCYCTGPEIETASEYIESIDVLHGIYFPTTEVLFTEYVDYFYAIKQNSDKDSSQYLMAKLFLNSLFGKFGMRRERENLVFSQSAEKGLEPYNEEEGIWITRSRSKAGYIIPSISAHITALARVELLKYLNEESYYCDTDSVYTGAELPTSSELGGLKMELRAIGECLFLAPKTYANSERMKHKGIPAKDMSDRRLLNYSKFRDAYIGEKVTVKWQCFDGFTESFPSHVQGQGRKAWDSRFIHWKERTRSLPMVDRKRIWTGDASRAIVLGMDEQPNGKE